MSGRLPRLIAALFLAPTAFAAMSPPLASKLSELLTPAHCVGAKSDPLSEARAEIETFRKEKKTTSALEKTLNEWLTEERSSGKDVPSLNWIRALDPWLLPKSFPARPAFVRCAAELRSYSDARAEKKTDLAAASEALTEALTEALAEWTNCLAISYPGGKPAEFEALAKCLRQ